MVDDDEKPLPDPMRDELWSVERDGPALLDGRPVSASSRSDLATALIATGFGYDAETRRRQAEMVARLLPAVRDIRRLGSAALDLCYVAAGRFEGFWEQHLKPWDVAAGALVVTWAVIAFGEVAERSARLDSILGSMTDGLWVYDGSLDAYVNAFVDHTKGLVIGDPMQKNTDIGPMVSAGQREKVVAQVEAAVASGAEVIGLAQAAQDATQKVEGLVEDDERCKRFDEKRERSDERLVEPSGSLKIEKDGRPPGPRTPPSAQMKGTWSPGKPCVPLPSRRGTSRLRGEAGGGACALLAVPLPPRAMRTTSARCCDDSALVSRRHRIWCCSRARCTRSPSPAFRCCVGSKASPPPLTTRCCARRSKIF